MVDAVDVDVPELSDYGAVSDGARSSGTIGSSVGASVSRRLRGSVARFSPDAAAGSLGAAEWNRERAPADRPTSPVL
jgi:hypothetical protein